MTPTAWLAPVLLAVLALVLAGPGPRLMARFTRFRRSPGPALFAWQAVGLSAVVAAVLVGPAILLGVAGGTDDLWSRLTARPPVAVAALMVSGVALGLVLLSGHRVGTGLRALRRRHRELVDVLARPLEQVDDRKGAASLGGRGTRQLVIEHASPTAYCLPGARQRVVLSSSALARLQPDELRALLAHEQAHLRARHDLVLEFFTVLHHAVPEPVRCPAALAEVRLLVEALADRSAMRRAGARPLARALVAVAGMSHPEASLGAGAGAAQTRAAASPARALTTLIVAFTTVVFLAPWAVLGWAVSAAV
jgi:Zn-dependent protease with chaperone function